MTKKNNTTQDKGLLFKILFSVLSIAIIATIIIADSSSNTPGGSAWESFPDPSRYQFTRQSGTLSADEKAHEVHAKAGETVPMYLTITNRNIDPLALVMFGIPPQGSLLPEVAPHRGGHEYRIGVKDDQILPWIDSASFLYNPDGQTNRFGVYDGPDANTGEELTFTWNLKIDENTTPGTYNLYTGIVREFDNWPWQVDPWGNVIPGGSDIFWKFFVTAGDPPEPEEQLDRVEIVDINGIALNNFEIDEEDTKQFYAKAYSTGGNNITADTNFLWSMSGQYNPNDVGYVTQTGLYTAGITADFYLNALKLTGSYNNRADTDTVSVTIGEVPPVGGDPQIDRVEIVDGGGEDLPAFTIDIDTNKQLYVKAYDDLDNDITADTNFTWSIDDQYDSTDVGTITSLSGLYTSGITAGLYLGAIKVSGLYNEVLKLDTSDVTIDEAALEIDRVEITDNSGVPLLGFSIDQDINKQLYAKAYSTTNEDITSSTTFTWSIDSNYQPTDVGTITNPGGLYTSGTTAGLYNGALRLNGNYNQKDVLDTVSVTINEAIVPPSGIRHTMIIDNPDNYDNSDILSFAEQGIDIINWVTVSGGKMTPYRDLGTGVYSLSQAQKSLVQDLYSAGQNIMWLGISYYHIDDIFPSYGWDPATEVAAAAKAFTDYFDEASLTNAKVGIYTGIGKTATTKHGLYTDESISWLHEKYLGWVSEYNPSYVWSWHNQYQGAEYARSAVKAKSIANGTWSRVIWLAAGADASVRRNTNLDDTSCNGGTFVRRDAEGTVCSYQLTNESNSYWAHHTQLPNEDGIEQDIPITEAQHLVYSGVIYMLDSVWQQQWWNAPACGTGCKSLAFTDEQIITGSVGARVLTQMGKTAFGIN